MIKCEICGKEFKTLKRHLELKHKMTIEKYQKKYKNAPVVDANYQKKMKNNRLKQMKKGKIK